jgi:hypothetical protein
VTPRVLGQLEVGAAAAATERAEKLAHQAVALETAHARDHGETRVEADGYRVRPRLEDQTLVTHVTVSARGVFFLNDLGRRVSDVR